MGCHREGVGHVAVGEQALSITVDGLDHTGESYEVRVFVNNPDADGRTRLAGNQGYSSSTDRRLCRRTPLATVVATQARLRWPRALRGTSDGHRCSCGWRPS